MKKIETSAIDDTKYFKLDGLEYRKNLVKIVYHDIEILNSAIDLTKLKLSLNYTENDTVLMSNTLMRDIEINGVVYSDLGTLVQLLSNQINGNFNSGGGTPQLTQDEVDAINNADNPNATNPFITLSNLGNYSTYIKEVKVITDDYDFVLGDETKYLFQASDPIAGVFVGTLTAGTFPINCELDIQNYGGISTTIVGDNKTQIVFDNNQGIIGSSYGNTVTMPRNARVKLFLLERVEGNDYWIMSYEAGEVPSSTGIGFTPENTENKTTSILDFASTVKFPTFSAVVAYITSLGLVSNIITSLGFTPANKAGDAFTGVISATNLSGTNTGDNATNIQYSGLAASKQDVPTQATGAVITFTTQKQWNTIASPTASNITDNLTGAVIMTTQKIYHNSGTAPSFPSGWVKRGTGNYVTGVLNTIYAEWSVGTTVEYWITQ